MNGSQRPLPRWLHVRLGRRWPRRRAAVLDNRLLGADWAWDVDEPDEEPTTIRTSAPSLEQTLVAVAPRLA